tara:strand:+ start:4446 stop:4637 length:192 start_codon:yes stop_codon:yes gene_type:complete
MKYKLKKVGFLGNLWYNIGVRTKWIQKYNIERDESLKVAKEALQEAFTPELKEMLKDKLDDKQ